MLAAILTKDEPWFIITTTIVQAVVTLGAVFLGARWALTREDRARRRVRSDEALTSIQGDALVPLSQLLSILVYGHAPFDSRRAFTGGDREPLGSWEALILRDVTDALNDHDAASADIWNDAAHILDAQLREAVVQCRTIEYRLTTQTFYDPSGFPWGAFFDWCLTGYIYVETTSRYVASALRGERYPKMPPSYWVMADVMELVRHQVARFGDDQAAPS